MIARCFHSKKWDRFADYPFKFRTSSAPMTEAPNRIPKAATITRPHTSALLAILTAIHRVGMI